MDNTNYQVGDRVLYRRHLRDTPAEAIIEEFSPSRKFVKLRFVFESQSPEENKEIAGWHCSDDIKEKLESKEKE